MHATNLDDSSASATDRDAALATVRTLLPMRYLSDTEFDRITAATDVEAYPAGKELFRSGHNDHFIFYPTTIMGHRPIRATTNLINFLRASNILLRFYRR